MAYNGAVLARARERLAERREQNAGLQQQRLNRVYALFPRVAEIDEELRRQMAALASLTWRCRPSVPAYCGAPGWARITPTKSTPARFAMTPAIMARRCAIACAASTRPSSHAS